MIKIEDCYRVLGLEPGASDDEIRRAYKLLVMKYHPDRGRGSDAARFQEVREAFQALADNRKQHQQFSRTGQGISEGFARSSRGRRGRKSPVSPLSDFQRRTGGGFGLFEEIFRSGIDEFLSGQAESDPLTEPSVEVILSPDEACMGGTIPLQVPISQPCPECSGRGGDWSFTCRTCGGRGIRQMVREINIRIPPGIWGDTCYEVDLGQRGRSRQTLRVLLRVSHHY